jgi:hypothetical protein
MRRSGYRTLSNVGRIVLVVLAISVGYLGVASAKDSDSRAELCSHLQRQLDETLEEHPFGPHVGEAKMLRKQGLHFCSVLKQSQGIRKFAVALKLLGVSPVGE